MKQAAVFGLMALVGAVVSFVVMRMNVKPLAFKDMPGLYRCDNFGVPDANYNRLQITPEMTLVSLARDKTFMVGRLAPREEDGAELEYSMETVHFSTFNLDPFTAPRLRAYKNHLAFTAREKEKTFTVNCERMAPN